MPKGEIPRSINQAGKARQGCLKVVIIQAGGKGEPYGFIMPEKPLSPDRQALGIRCGYDLEHKLTTPSPPGRGDYKPRQGRLDHCPMEHSHGREKCPLGIKTPRGLFGGLEHF